MFKFTLDCLDLFYIFVNKLMIKTFHIHLEPKLAESLPQQKSNLIFVALTVAVNDKIQNCCLAFLLRNNRKNTTERVLSWKN